MGRYYVTTPIYYVNDVPHIGHAYTTLAADVLARYKRMDSFDVYFLTGTDEHGQKIERAANEKNLGPKEFADQVVVRFKDLWKKMNITNDDFIRTTEQRHERVVKWFFEKLYAKGDIYLGTYEGLYCVSCETFLTTSQLIDGGCPVCKRKPELVREPNYFFRLSKYQHALLKLYEEHPEFVRPDFRLNEVVSFVRQGLEDLSISRASFKWGISVPNDPQHVIYVWFDALINYVSGLGQPDGGSELYKKFWPADVHLIGKDILRHHAIYWPAFLLAADVSLPKTVFAHGWWTVEGEKMSKSFGNIVDPYEMIETYGLDQFRYFLLREVPFGLDGDFSRDAVKGRINSELANDLGNLLGRAQGMCLKYFSGKLKDLDSIEGIDEKLIEAAGKMDSGMRAGIDEIAFHHSLEALIGFVDFANKYIDQTAPWTLFKENKMGRLARVLYSLLESLRQIALHLAPFCPDSAQKMWEALGQAGNISDARFATAGKWGIFNSEIEIKRTAALFPRIE